MRDAAPPPGLHIRCELGGLTLRDQPVLPGVDAVVVEALVRGGSSTAEASRDFSLRVGDRPALVPESARASDDGRATRLFFRFAPPDRTVVSELRWRDRSVATLTIPVVTPAEFMAGVKIADAGLLVRRGGDLVAARAFVASQVREGVLVARVQSTSSLAPLRQMELACETVALASGRKREKVVSRQTASLGADQLASRQAIVAVPWKRPRAAGAYATRWNLDGMRLGETPWHAVAERAFRESLRVSAARFGFVGDAGRLASARYAPSDWSAVREFAPAFVVASSFEGMTADVEVTIRTVPRTPGEAAREETANASLRGGHALASLDLLDASERERIETFELWAGERRLGLLSPHPVPKSAFTAEGGVDASANDFAWSADADAQLSSRLAKLME